MLVEVPLSIVGAWRSSFQVTWHLSFLKCCCRPPCERQADALLSKKFHQQFQLHSVVRIVQIACFYQSLFLPLESFAESYANPVAFSPVFFVCLFVCFLFVWFFCLFGFLGGGGGVGGGRKVRFYVLQASCPWSVPSASLWCSAL